MGRYWLPVSPPVASGQLLSLAEVMMVNASTLSLHTFVKTFLAMLTHTCVVPLLNVMARSSSLGMKIPGRS